MESFAIGLGFGAELSIIGNGEGLEEAWESAGPLAFGDRLRATRGTRKLGELLSIKLLRRAVVASNAQAVLTLEAAYRLDGT